jgi:hypothetical protein
MHLGEEKFVSLTRKSLIALVAATVVLALLALPGNAAPEKQFSLRFPTSLGAGTQNITVTLKNETPNGNSNINSFRITGTTAATGFSINSISPGSGVLSNGNKTISVSGISTLKPQQIATYTLNITVPSVGCAGGSIAWTGAAFTGNSLNGDPFRLHSQTESGPSQLTTSISAGCTTISVNKYEDANANGSKGATEGAPTQSFSFDLKSGSTTLQTKSTNASGVATFDAVSTGSYTVCESAPLPSGWHNTDPTDGTGCKSVTASSATASVTFGNAKDITIDVNKFQDSNLNGTQQDGEPGLDGWDFTLDGNAAGTTAGGGALSFTASPGVSHDVCEVAQDGWFSTTGGDCQTITAGDATSASTVSLDFGNAHGELGCTSEDNNIAVTGDDDPNVSISGVRLENKDNSPCIKIPYVFNENPDGGFIFTKDNSVQPQAQFLITQDVVRDTVVSDPSGQYTSNTINGYTTEISYDNGANFEPVPVCPIVHRDAQNNITGAELPDGMTTGYCVADQAANYGVPSASQVTIHTVLYGFGDPMTRTRPI